jgi:hypothetical protein
MSITSHNFENIGELVEKHELDILNYYPYGPKTEWSYWLCGTVDLRKEYKSKRNKNKTELDYISNIFSEVARAMHYLTVYTSGHSGGSTDHQRLNAFALSHLFNSGIHDFTKKYDALPEKDIEKLIKFHKDRSDRLNHSGKYASKDQKEYDKKVLESRTYEEKIKQKKMEEEHKKHHRETYGIYEVEHFPLRSRGVNFYTKQQLAAIELMVDCAFENLC